MREMIVLSMFCYWNSNRDLVWIYFLIDSTSVGTGE
jgi:hypothetical protein